MDVSVWCDVLENVSHSHFDATTIYRLDQTVHQCCYNGKRQKVFFIIKQNTIPAGIAGGFFIYLKSDANRFFGMVGIRSVVVRRLELLDVWTSSSAEKNASDGFSDVNEMVLWTSRVISSSDIIFGLNDDSESDSNGWGCGAECDISSGNCNWNETSKWVDSGSNRRRW